jgi:pimeloyl-ACP methyl ester carboxylesterase
MYLSTNYLRSSCSIVVWSSTNPRLASRLVSLVARAVVADRQFKLHYWKEHVVTDERIHRAASDDGTEIVGTVQGDGPPLVFVHGAMDDGTLQWGPVVPYLADRFTCHVMSVRNRGRSGHSEDLLPPRFVEDIAAYASSVREPVGLVGLSAGGTWVLSAAIRLADVTGVVAYEPVVIEVMSEEVRYRYVGAVMREREEAEQGRLTVAVRIVGEFVGNDEEVAALDAAGAFETMGVNVPADLAGIQQSMEYQGPSATDPSVLAQITAPVLLLQGSKSNVPAWFHAGVRHLAEHVPQATVHEFADLGHLAPMVAAERVAEEIARFFTEIHAAAGSEPAAGRQTA